MSGYPNPSPNGYPYNNGYAPQAPIYSGIPPTGPGHAPLPGNPGYFGNGMYATPTTPYSAYNQPPFAPNHPVGTPSQMTPSSDTKRPLPTPRAPPASVVYPPQAMSYPSPSTPIHQRSMTFDPAAAAGPSYTNPVGIPQNSAFNSVGARPASVAFPPGWNPYPPSPVATAGRPFSVAPPSSFSGASNRGAKKDAELPPLPPGASTPSPSTPAALGKRTLPNAPGMGPGIKPVSAWDAQQAGAPSPPDKRPLPTPSQSLPRISTMSDIQGTSFGQATSPPSAGTSSPTKRALPTAPGAGGIKPGTSFPTASSQSVPRHPISNISSQGRQTRDTTSVPPSGHSGEESAPTSAPSSYASARSVFSTPSSTSSFVTAGAVTRPSSYSSPSPPPTGAPRSTASDTTGGAGSGDDKRPLWKRMASGQASSRPQSVFGYRRGGEEIRGGKEVSASVSAALSGALADDRDNGVRAASKENVQQAPSPTPAPPLVQVKAPSPAPVPTPASRHAPLPTPPAAAQTRGAPSVVKPQESKQRGASPTPGSGSGNGSRQGNTQGQSNSPKSQMSAVQVNTVNPVRPVGPAVLPAGVQPTPIVPYQPKSRPPKAAEPPKPLEQEPIVSTRHAENPSRGSSTAPTPIPGGKVRFSREPQIQPSSPPRAIPSTAGPASPSRPSEMKGGAKSPPRAPATKVEGHSRAASAGVIHSRTPQQRQYQIPLAQPSAAAPPPPTAAPQVSMALRFASMDLQDEARAPDGDWAKWALVSSHDVATKPVPLTGHAPAVAEAPVREKDSRRRRSASTGAIAATLEDPPPAPVINPVRRGSVDAASGGVDTASMIKAASASGGMRRGGARPMPSSRSSSRSRAQSRSPSEEYPQYKPSYSDSDDEDGKSGPTITISAAPQISVSAPAPEVPSIHIEGDDDAPVISITVDEPEPPVNAASIVFAFSGPEEDQAAEPVSPVSDKAVGKKKKHRREKSVKEEEDERERARQRAKTRPLPPKIKKNSARCGKCDKPILGRIVSAMNARWHPECFKCSVCETFLEHVSSYEHDDRPYCHLDYHELFAPRCFHCQTPIMEEHFITLDDDALGKRTYHEQHFFCAECGDPFLTPKQERKTRQLENGMLEVLDQDDEVGFTVYKGHPYCEACHVRLRMPKCKRCRKSIRPGDQAIEALGGKWCWECFTCNRCSKPFDDPQFYEHEKKPFCQPCYSILLVNQLG